MQSVKDNFFYRGSFFSIWEQTREWSDGNHASSVICLCLFRCTYWWTNWNVVNFYCTQFFYCSRPFLFGSDCHVQFFDTLLWFAGLSVWCTAHLTAIFSTFIYFIYYLLVRSDCAVVFLYRARCGAPVLTEEEKWCSFLTFSLDCIWKGFLYFFWYFSTILFYCYLMLFHLQHCVAVDWRL